MNIKTNTFIGEKWKAKCSKTWKLVQNFKSV